MNQCLKTRLGVYVNLRSLISTSSVTLAYFDRWRRPWSKSRLALHSGQDPFKQPCWRPPPPRRIVDLRPSLHLGRFMPSDTATNLEKSREKNKNIQTKTLEGGEKSTTTAVAISRSLTDLLLTDARRRRAVTVLRPKTPSKAARQP